MFQYCKCRFLSWQKVWQKQFYCIIVHVTIENDELHFLIFKRTIDLKIGSINTMMLKLIT